MRERKKRKRERQGSFEKMGMKKEREPIPERRRRWGEETAPPQRMTSFLAFTNDPFKKKKKRLKIGFIVIYYYCIIKIIAKSNTCFERIPMDPPPSSQERPQNPSNLNPYDPRILLVLLLLVNNEFGDLHARAHSQFFSFSNNWAEKSMSC